MTKKASLIKAIAKGERGALTFLGKHSAIVHWTFLAIGGHSSYVAKEFPFGSRYKADFVVPLSFSGAWEVHLIELEPPDDPVINKEGTPSQRFNKALSQINDREQYVTENPQAFRKDLSDWCRKKDLLKWYNHTGRKPRNYTGDYLHDPSTFINFNYHIVIGRRESMDTEKRRRVNQCSNRWNVKVCTYGRFLYVGDNVDRAAANPIAGIWLTQSNEDDFLRD